MAKWRKEEEERRVAGLPTIFEGMDERSRNWILARVPAIAPDGNFHSRSPQQNKFIRSWKDLQKCKRKVFSCPTGRKIC
jgi:hypothetical protein